MPQIRRALISVSDKRGLPPFAKALRSMNVEIISTGGTLSTLQHEGIEATSVEEVTGFPEILDGRVKTLHPHIHAALLAVATNQTHVDELSRLGINPIDMVVVNLYPFEETITRADIAVGEATEQIDIGGPAMMRAAAKNFMHKAVVVNPDQYDGIIEEMRERGGALSESTCRELAGEAFRRTATYDSAIANFMGSLKGDASLLPSVYIHGVAKASDLRYGENPHQRAALYGNFSTYFKKLHGKEISYNNIVDLIAAAELVSEFDEPTVAIIKHTNPCGVGSGKSLADAYRRGLATDKTSAFGGIVASNSMLDFETAGLINEIFTEVIVAPSYTDDALKLLQRKKDRRLIQSSPVPEHAGRFDLRSVPGGLLLQERDNKPFNANTLKIVTTRHPSNEESNAMMFAWRVAKHVKSNAIVYALSDRTLGIGAGQMSRVDSSRLAVAKANEAKLSLVGSAVASDAFFPFADGLLEAVHAGATCVIQPGGSIRDDEVIAAANQHNIAMAFTGIRHFKH